MYILYLNSYFLKWITQKQYHSRLEAMSVLFEIQKYAIVCINITRTLIPVAEINYIAVCLLITQDEPHYTWVIIQFE